MKFRTYIFTLIVIAGFSTYLYAAQSVTLTPLDSPDTLSNGKSYFLAGKMFRFRVQAIDPLAGGRPYWNTITLDLFRTTLIAQAIQVLASWNGVISISIISRISIILYNR